MRRLIPLPLLATLALAGCGGDDPSSSGAGSPASMAPVDAVAYGEVTLDGDADQVKQLESLVDRVGGEGTVQKARDMLAQELAKEDLDYDSDVSSWLGDTAGGFLLPAAGDGEGAVVVAADDPDAAQEAVDRVAKAEGQTERAEFEGVSYWTGGDGSAAGVVGDWVVLGTRKGFEAAVNTSEADETLQDSEQFNTSLEDAPEERLGVFYADYGKLLEIAGRGGDVPPEQLEAFKDIFGEDPISGAAVSEEDAVRFESNVPPGVASFFFGGLGGGTGGALAELPAGSWLATGQAEVGKTANQLIETFAGSAGISREDIDAQVGEATGGLDLSEDILGWMGDLRVFVRGTSLTELSGAAVVESLDEDASKRALDALARVAQEMDPGDAIKPVGDGYEITSPEVPEPITITQQDGQVVFGYGEGIVDEALDPGEQLADDEQFERASDALGDDYAINTYVDIAPILELADSLGASGDSEYTRAKRYLEKLGTYVTATRGEGDDLQSVARLSVR